MQPYFLRIHFVLEVLHYLLSLHLASKYKHVILSLVFYYTAEGRLHLDLLAVQCEVEQYKWLRVLEYLLRYFSNRKAMGI